MFLRIALALALALPIYFALDLASEPLAWVCVILLQMLAGFDFKIGRERK